MSIMSILTVKRLEVTALLYWEDFSLPVQEELIDNEVQPLDVLRLYPGEDDFPLTRSWMDATYGTDLVQLYSKFTIYPKR
jgi:hypothetical protein